MGSIAESDLLSFPDGFDCAVDEPGIHCPGVIDLDKYRHVGGSIAHPAEQLIRRLLEGRSQLAHHVFQRHDQGKFRIVEDFQVFENILVQGVGSLFQLPERESRFLQQQQIPLDCSWRRMEMIA